ncbi:adrenocortical dysplasia protein homolog [Polymixia lowei]
MPRTRSSLEPWIEDVILKYGTEQKTTTGQLRAHVVGVGQLSNSEAQGTEGPTGLLFLSDGVVQIPAILTESAWEHLQEQEDRECFSSLVNTTVCLQAYHLKFHMALEQTKCRFFLLVGELATTAAGTVKEITPCCTSLSSVRLKISKTWRTQFGHDTVDTQSSQHGFDLSELLGEWQHDCLQALLDDVSERLRTTKNAMSSRPSTSSCIPSLLPSDTYTGTGWDADRIRFKGLEPFNIPLSHLLMPDEEAQRPQAVLDEGSETPSGLLVPSEDRMTDSRPATKQTSPPVVHDLKWQRAEPEILEKIHNFNEHTPPQASILNEDMVAGMNGHDMSNPWDIFDAPCDVLCTSSCSDVSMTSEVTPPQLVPIPAVFHTECVTGAITSTQVPSNGSGVSQTSEQSKGGDSFLPPYQKPQSTSGLVLTSGSSNSETSAKSIARPLNLSLSTGSHSAKTTQHPLPMSEPEKPQADKDTEMQEEVAQTKCRVAKRKRNEQPPDSVTDSEEDDAVIALSPPSWLFETQAVSGSDAGSSLTQGKTAGTVSRKTPAVHSDGTQFSYSYKVSSECLQDLSKFKIADDVLHWAVKYLVVPKQT